MNVLLYFHSTYLFVHLLVCYETDPFHGQVRSRTSQAADGVVQYGSRFIFFLLAAWL